MKPSRIGFYATTGVTVVGTVFAIPPTFLYPFRWVFATATADLDRHSDQGGVPVIYGGAFGVLVGLAALVMLAAIASLLIELAAKLWGVVPDVKEGSSNAESGTLLRVREAGRNGRLR